MRFFTHTALALLATTALAHPRVFQRTPQRNGDSTNRGGITQTLECTRAEQDGTGNVNRVPCEDGEDGCTCLNRFTEIRCNRVLQDGTGNTSRESCDQAEEGQNGCQCGETVATRQEERCSRVLQDGTGNTSIESCNKSEEGVDGCECSITTGLVDSLP
ncbi:hypothetical protein HG531_013647 [Fusarium graminearum]|uniref:Uncharacterized protein n=1 Tax=Fusarium austroamericanum TaxID=282268 RepID=A0AAN5Z9Y9_FUSAU|nr:hypothetical protein FAUST_6356 [Fusarium austroamericanum]KAI6760074.1 hypothetical protein HG531_013647 [Fusarium graminearum]